MFMMRKEKKTANAVSHGVEASMKNLIMAVNVLCSLPLVLKLVAMNGL